MAIGLVLAEEYLLREGVRRVTDTQPDLELVGVCGDYDSLLTTTEREHPDVVLTDIRMPPTSTDEGIRVATPLRGTSPGVGVVVLSQYASAAYALALLEGGSGGRAYLLKERVSDVEELLGAHSVGTGPDPLGGCLLRPQELDQRRRGPDQGAGGIHRSDSRSRGGTEGDR